jgi:uncharacterized protein (TIGR00297 family)
VNWLTRTGVGAAALVGGAVVWGLGWGGLVPLVAFLASGSLLARLTEGAEGAGPRTARQVFANGGIAGLAALGHLWPAAAGAIAAAAADTWATEIGARAPRSPRLITSGRPVPPGTSGGITPLGTMGGVAGAVLMAIISGGVARELRWRGVVIVAIAGVAGMLADSVFGATLQGRFVCPECGRVMERPGFCHAPVRLDRGLRWMDNDVVNWLGSLTGAMVAMAGQRLAG